MVCILYKYHPSGCVESLQAKECRKTLCGYMWYSWVMINKIDFNNQSSKDKNELPIEEQLEQK